MAGLLKINHRCCLTPFYVATIFFPPNDGGVKVYHRTEGNKGNMNPFFAFWVELSLYLIMVYRFN